MIDPLQNGAWNWEELGYGGLGDYRTERTVSGNHGKYGIGRNLEGVAVVIMELGGV